MHDTSTLLSVQSSRAGIVHLLVQRVDSLYVDGMLAQSCEEMRAGERRSRIELVRERREAWSGYNFKSKW